VTRLLREEAKELQWALPARYGGGYGLRQLQTERVQLTTDAATRGLVARGVDRRLHSQRTPCGAHGVPYRASGVLLEPRFEANRR